MDLRYGRTSLVEELLRTGVCSATIFLSHIISWNPFVAKFFLRFKWKPGFDEDDGDGEKSTGTGRNEINGASIIDNHNIQFDTLTHPTTLLQPQIQLTIPTQLERNRIPPTTNNIWYKSLWFRNNF